MRRLRRSADSIVSSPLPAKRNIREEGRGRGGKFSSSARLAAGLLALAVLFCAGCSGPLSRFWKAENTLAKDPRLGSLDRAELLRSQGDYAAAAIEYRKVIDCAETEWDRQEARIGAAKSLIKLHRYAAAMKCLGCLPVAAESDYDCRRLAIAGEILLRQRRPEEAETCLELALDACALEVYVTGFKLANKTSREPAPGSADTIQAGLQIPEKPMPDPDGEDAGFSGATTDEAFEMMPVPEEDAEICDIRPPSWMPAACANLGRAYLKNGKPEKAAVMYEFTAHLSRLCDEKIAAERAQRISDELNAVIRQYAPYKPPPIARGFPPGKS